MRTFLVLSTSCALLACDSGGTSTTEMKAAAEQRFRDQFKLPAATPVKSRIWTGHEQYEGANVLCGTVSSESSNAVRPQRFAATGKPFRWLVFEDAHDAMVVTRTEMFPDWENYCAEGQAG